MDAPAVVRGSGQLLASLALGFFVLAAGVGGARLWLPSWGDDPLPPPEVLETRFLTLVGAAEIESDPGRVTRRVVTRRHDDAGVRSALGDRAAQWERDEGRSVLVRYGTSARWHDVDGRLTVTLSGRSVPVRLDWAPVSFGEFLGLEGNKPSEPEAVATLMLQPGETLAPESSSWNSGGTQILAWEAKGEGLDEHVLVFDLPGGSMLATRRPGDPALGAGELGAVTTEGVTLQLLRELVPALIVVALFFWAAYRQRLGLINGAIVAAVYLVAGGLSVRTWWGPSGVSLLVMVVGYGLWLLVLWSVADSLMRSNVEGFTTSLDGLIRGALGPRSGTALLSGVALGAMLAGARLGLAAVVTRFALGSPGTAFPELPLFDGVRNPIGEGVAWLGLLLVAYALLLNLLPERGAAILAGLITGAWMAPVPLVPWPAEVVVGVALSVGLAEIFRRRGLATALVAVVVYSLLPAGVQAIRFSPWMTPTATLSAGSIVALLLLGVVGRRRVESAQQERIGVPSFVLRLERQRRLDHEMALLARIQKGLQPRVLPRVAGYEITARSFLAAEAGGDLYDFRRDDQGRLWIAAGDVSGHGYSCAIAQATVKAALVSLVRAEATPGVILAGVDAVLRATVSERQFTTLLLVRLDPTSGDCLLANAGHPFPLLARDGSVEEVDAPGLPLGQGPQRFYRDVALSLDSGNVLLCYSDGLAEAMAAGERPYGFDRPAQVLAQTVQWNAAEILDRLLVDWNGHLGGQEPEDDTTLVVVKRIAL